LVGLVDLKPKLQLLLLSWWQTCRACYARRDVLCRAVSTVQWRQNEFESGGHQSGAKVVVPPTFLALKIGLSRFGERLIRRFSWSVQFCQFLVCCSSTHGAPCPAICKSGARPPVLYGVGALALSCCGVLSHLLYSMRDTA